MTHPTELDLGPLTWVKNEIDLALARADESLEQALSAPDAPGRVQFAQTHLHQVRGALSIVGLDGLTQFAVSLDLSLGALARGERPIDGGSVALTRRALATIGNYLEELVHGTPDQPLRLLPLYREIVALRSSEAVSPAELFFPDLSRRPPRRQIALAELPEDARQAQLRTQRAQFQRGLLQWLKTPGDAAGPTTMLNAVQSIESLHSGMSVANFWYASQAFLEALAQGDLPVQPEVKRLCSQLDAQLKRLTDTTAAIPDRLIRELLYWTAQAPERTAQQKAVRETWHIDALIPEPGSTVSVTPLAPLLRSLQASMAGAKHAWDEFSEGHAAALPRFASNLADVAAQAPQLGRPALDRLLQALIDFIRWLRKDPLQNSDKVAIEVATALLLAEGALDRVVPDAGFSAQVADTVHRLEAVARGEAVEAAEFSATVATARRLQERDAVGQLAREILSSLAQVEQILDDYFRNQQKRAPLAGLGSPLKQIEGALTLIGDPQAISLVHDAAATVARIAESDAQPEPGQFEDLAQRLSALGFYVQALQHGPASLATFLDPSSAAPSVEEAPAITIDVPRFAEELAPAPKAAAPTVTVPAKPEAAAVEAPAAASAQEAPPPPPVPAVEPLLPEVAQASPPATVERIEIEPPEHELAPEFEDAEALLAPFAPPPAPAAQPAVAPLIQKPAAPLPSAAEIDAELLEIFIEEAHEVLANIGEQLELSRTAPSNVEHLTSIRRGFHTLKGSGRMVGLRDLGEAAWGFEQTLNRWLQLEWTPTPALHHLIGAAHHEFSDWVSDLEAGSNQARDVQALMAEAERLRSSDGPISEPAPLDVAAAPEMPAARGEAIAEENLVFDALELAETGEVLPLAAPAPQTVATADLVEVPQIDEFQLEALPEEVPLEEPEDLVGSPAAVTEEHGPESVAEALPETAEGPGEAVFELGDLELPSIDLEEVTGQELAPSPREAEDLMSHGEAAEEVVLPEFAVEPAPPSPADVEEVQLIELPPALEPAVEPDAAVRVESPLAPEEPFLLEEALEAEERVEALDTEESVEVVEPLEEEALELEEAPESGPTASPSETSAPVEHEEATVSLEELEAAAERDVVRVGDNEISRPLYDLYVGEARHHLATLHIELARLAANPTLVPAEAALRAAHTLAGISGTTRLMSVQGLARALEHAIERLREGAHPPTPEQAAVLKSSNETLEAMLAQVAIQQMPLEMPELIEQLDSIGRTIPLDIGLEADEPAIQQEAAPSPAVSLEAEERQEAPLADDLDDQLLPVFLEEGGELLADLHATLRRWSAGDSGADHAKATARLLHTLKGSARMAGAMALGEHVHQLESHLEAGREVGRPAEELIEELVGGLDTAEQLMQRLSSPPEPTVASAEQAVPTGIALEAAAAEAETGATSTLRVRAETVDRFVNEAGEIGIARTRIAGELRTLRRSLLDLTENVIRLRNQLREVEIQADVQMQSRIAHTGTQDGDFDPLEMDRYTRLQELTRMMAESVGDVTTVQQSLLRNLDGAELALNSQARLSRDLQQALMQVRMVPFNSLADRLYRVTRQTAKDLGKRANLDLRGGRIEIDRSVLEHITAPLEHLLRNAIAHGIESPETRAAAGKNEIGQITLAVSQEGNEIAISLADDGAGLDYEKIAERARASGLLGPNESADERRLTNLIFLPGFSTASNVSTVSGRGVGMDVVKAETAAVGGRIDIRATRHKGTEFRIYLPLTLAVTQALLVSAGGRTFAIPSSMVAQVMELKLDALHALRTAGGTEWQDIRFNYRYLPRLLGDRTSQPEEQRFNWVLLLRAGAQTLALHVDALRGNQEIVVKNAGPQLARVVGISGATVLGDGEIVLILNPVALASRSLAESAEAEGEGLEPLESAEPEIQPTVMVVDDSLTVRKITGRLLEREGYRVITAKDGVEALERLLEILPDVILSDIEMPRMDGFDLLRNIRADERTRAIPVIMITSRLADKHRQLAEKIGANEYLGKPYEEAELLDLLRSYTGKKLAEA